MQTSTAYSANSSGNSSNGIGNSNPVLRGVETTGTALHTGIDKVADPARNAIDKASSVAHEQVDRLTESAMGVADRFADQTRRVQEAPARAVDYSKSWVQERPLQAVGTALALGFIIGRLTAR